MFHLPRAPDPVAARTSTPTPAQIEAARAVTAWYMALYHGTRDDPGVGEMFCDPNRIGSFALPRDALAAGEASALFRLVVAVAMFQRRGDLQIEAVLRGIPAAAAEELCCAPRLLELADRCVCPHARTLDALLTRCDLRKDPATGLGTCGAAQAVPCALKSHTVLLKRYGHFGKVPTSLALMLRERGVPDLPALRALALAEGRDPDDVAVRLESMLCRAWRVSDKIAAMALSILTNPDLSPGLAPWVEGVGWRRYVVIDSNVDLFLRRVGYPGPWTYAARRAFISALAAEVDLASMKPGVQAFNPRLVQQAMYLSQSVLNRRARARDCTHLGGVSCHTCRVGAMQLCPLRAHPHQPQV